MTPEAPEILTRRKSQAGRVLLPYQVRWLADKSDLKAWEKSRRIGADYTEAYDVAQSRITEKRNEHYWYSSADESAAYEFAEYVRFWMKVYGKVADYFTEQIPDPKTQQTATAFCVRFPCGARMTAMTSNPRRFRSKGGDVGLSELAYHDDERAMYDAALPCITWGGKLRVMTTHNGEDTFFNRDIVQPAKRIKAGEAVPGAMPFSVHTVTIVAAVNEGLVEKINETKGTHFTREEFLARVRGMCRNEDQWNQEFMAIPSTNASAWLPYELLESCQSDLAGLPSNFSDGPRYIGMDVGENQDPTRIVTLERVGDVLWVREIVTFRAEPLRIKEDALLVRQRHAKVVRSCIDGTGVGAQIAQAAQAEGKGESVKFSLPVKDALASPLRGLFEDQRIRIPRDAEVREDLHAIRMTRTISGAPRFDAERTEAGHADVFWALALAVNAAIIGPTYARFTKL